MGKTYRSWQTRTGNKWSSRRGGRDLKRRRRDGLPVVCFPADVQRETKEVRDDLR